MTHLKITRDISWGLNETNFLEILEAFRNPKARPGL